MALDNIHHLEGTLVSPGVFRIYLYDSYTRPLEPAKVKQAKGTLRWGDAADSPETPLTVSKDGETLETRLNGDVKFPLNLNLQLFLPGAASGSKPEAFKFPFSHYTESASDNHNEHSQ